jgi:large subunit ribosomal protein L16
MLIPTQTKFKKYQKTKIKKVEKKNNASSYTLQYGTVGLQALENGLVTPQQLESVRRVLIKQLRKVGKLWVNVYPDWVITKKPKEVRMGRGKGDFSNYACRVFFGKILLELHTSQRKNLIPVLLSASKKLPIKSRIIIKPH